MTEQILKKIIELAKGFEQLKGNIAFESCVRYKEQICIITQTEQWDLYPLLLRRAVEGWNRKNGPYLIQILTDNVECFGGNGFRIINNYFEYTDTEYLTQQEQAIEACLVELLS